MLGGGLILSLYTLFSDHMIASWVRPLEHPPARWGHTKAPTYSNIPSWGMHGTDTMGQSWIDPAVIQTHCLTFHGPDSDVFFFRPSLFKRTPPKQPASHNLIRFGFRNPTNLFDYGQGIMTHDLLVQARGDQLNFLYVWFLLWVSLRKLLQECETPQSCTMVFTFHGYYLNSRGSLRRVSPLWSIPPP